MNILEEFWYGNIEPAEYDVSSSYSFGNNFPLYLAFKPPVRYELGAFAAIRKILVKIIGSLY